MFFCLFSLDLTIFQQDSKEVDAMRKNRWIVALLAVTLAGVCASLVLRRRQAAVRR